MSGASKFGRGAGRGQSRMVAPPPPPMGRGAVQLRRVSAPLKDKGRFMKEDGGVGKGRGRGMQSGGLTTGGANLPQVEENFQVVSSDESVVPLYAMAIRLTPGFLEKLKQAEELGEVTTMKFGEYSSGHSIRLGGEEFTFSSAPELGELCDIFEEQRRGEDGNGLLVESGSVWRKVSVNRTLSATEKDRVKKRSVEAERQQKSRKAIVLDHSNAFINKVAAPNEGPAIARRPPIKAKKEPPQKKQKLISSSVISVPKSKLASTVAEKPPTVTKPSKVIVASSPEPVNADAPPAFASTMASSKTKTSAAEESIGTIAPKLIPTISREKVSSPAVVTTCEGGAVGKAAASVNMTELRNCLITLLTENPKGLTIKAVEKALGEVMPTVRPDKKHIEKAIKAIAVYQTPGRYLLKQGVEKGSFAKPSPGSGSSPEIAPVDSPALVDSPAPADVGVEAVTENCMTDVHRLGDKNMVLQSDTKKSEVMSRISLLPGQRGGENNVTRAIRKAEEKLRGNAEKLQSAGQPPVRNGIDLDANKLEEPSILEAVLGHGTADVDQISIGRDESPVTGSSEREEQGLANDSEVIPVSEDQKLPSPKCNTVDKKKDNSDASDSSSASGSGSESESDSDSESDNDSGNSDSGSGSGSESDSDGSSRSRSASPSASEEENVDEDVDIISDDERSGAESVEPSKQRTKSSKSLIHRQESKAQKQVLRPKDQPKKPKQKAPDPTTTPHDSEDVDIGDGEDGAETSKLVGTESFQKSINSVAVEANAEIEVDVTSDGVAQSPHEDGAISATESPKSAKYDSHSTRRSDENDVEGGVNKQSIRNEDGHKLTQAKNESESDHSIEEYETRAEKSGARGGRAKLQFDQELPRSIDPVGKKEQVEGSLSPNERVMGVKPIVVEPAKTERGNKVEVGAGKVIRKGGQPAMTFGSDILARKEHPLSGVVLPRTDHVQKSLLGLPQMARESHEQMSIRTGKDVLLKVRGFADAKKPSGKDTDSPNQSLKTPEISELSEKVAEGPKKSFQRPSKTVDANSKGPKLTEALPKVEGGSLSKVSDVAAKFSKDGDESSTPGKESDGRDNSFTDPNLRSRPDVQSLGRPDFYWRQNKEPSLLGKPGRGADFASRFRDSEHIVSVSKEKDGGYPAKANRDVKQARKITEKSDIMRKYDVAERGVSGIDVGEKTLKDPDAQKWLHKECEAWQRSPKEVELVGKVASETEAHIGRFRDGRKGELDRLEVKNLLRPEDNKKVSSKEDELKGSSDLELGELRELVAGEEARGREISRLQAMKHRDQNDALGKQTTLKVHMSPEKDRLKIVGKPSVDSVKVPPVDPKVQARNNKDTQKVDHLLIARETNRQVSGLVKHDPRPESGLNRAVDGTKAKGVLSDACEKVPEGRVGKRPTEDGGNFDSGRPPKKPLLAPSHMSSVVRGDTDIISARLEKVGFVAEQFSKASSSEVMKGSPVQGWNNSTGLVGKTQVENGRMQATKVKNTEACEKDSVERRGIVSDSKHKTSAGLLGAGLKRENLVASSLSNGKKLAMQTGDTQGHDFFAPYEKKVPDLKGPILKYEQYLEYFKEYNDKYAIYFRLHTILESDKEDFESFSRDISNAKASDDKNKLAIIYGKVRKDYMQCRKRFKRMQCAFQILHEELRGIKQRCLDYASKLGQG